MAVNAGNIVRSGDLIAYVAPYAAANAMPANSAWGTAWGAPYRDVGATDGGLGFNIGMNFEDVTIDQSIDPVAVIATGRDVRLTGSMAEFTLQNLKDATAQGTLATTPPASGVRGHADYTLDSQIGVNFLTVGFDIKHVLGDGEPLRPVLWKGQVRSAVSATFNRNATAVLPFEVQAFPDTANANRVLTFRDIIAPLP